MTKRVKRYVVDIIIVVGTLGIAVFLWEQLHAVHISERAENIQITAHRGDSGHAPENTLPAIESAIAKRADYVEIDIRRTADDRLVLMHDSSAMRTAGIERCIEECSFAEVDLLDVGSWYGTKYAGTTVPTLEDVLKLSKGRIGVNIEIKSVEGDDRIAGKVVEELRRCEMEAECTVTSSNYEILKAVEKENSMIRTGIILSDADNWRDYDAVDFYSVSLQALNRTIVKEMKAVGKEIHVWTANEANEIRMAMEYQLDNIITDMPEETRDFIKNL